MRVCLLSSRHSPSDDRIYFKEARSLSRCHDVWIISPYPEKIPIQAGNVHFRAITAPVSAAQRWQSIDNLYQAGLDVGADCFHCHEPESLLAAIRLKRELGARVIFDSHELHGASLAQRFPRASWRFVQAAYQMLEKNLLRQCDFGIGASWPITDYLATVLGRDKTETILNCPIPEVFGPVAVRTILPPTNRFMHVRPSQPPPPMRNVMKARRIVNSGDVSLPTDLSPP